MRNCDKSKKRMPNPMRWVWLIVTLLSAFAVNVQASDWMYNSSKFYLTNTDAKDHVTFNVFLADLDRNNTYAKSGCVYAKSSSGRTLWLVDLWYISEGSDENPFGKVRSRVCVGEARAWFTNGYGQGEQKISNDGTQDYLLRKWGSDNHYLTAVIDFYYPATMAGETWTFYYDFVHVDHSGSHTQMKLGTATLNKELGLSHFDTSNYEVERTSPDKIKFTVPGMPNDVSDKLSDIHIHEGIYYVTFTYTKQDNTKVETKDTLQCEKGKTKSYDIAIPDNVGNPKQVDLSVRAIDALRDAKNYYWKNTSGYSKNSVFQTVPIPSNLTAEYRQFDKAASLSWKAFSIYSDNYMECTPYIYRVETDKNGEPLNGSWGKRGSIEKAGTDQNMGYSDNNVTQSSYYKFMVLNVPTAWIDHGISKSSLNNPDENILQKLGYVESKVLNTAPSMSIYELKQDTTVNDKVKLTWSYSRVPTSSSTVNFKVMRKTSNDGEWAEYGSVNGDAEPKAGATLSFDDTDLPNVSTRYQYKIRLSLDNGKSIFESDPIYAGLLSGSMVKSFEATKGTHQGTVRLSWKAKQVGTDNTTYVISRRYVDGGGDYMQINTVNGTADLYTSEDNTVQPGYFYEYKIEAYNGDVLQNSLTDAGFCQAKGVISGRVTYGTGSAVEDVRLSLRSSDTGDDNMVRGYSQRFDGVTTGIKWDSDSTELAKIFGNGKDYTVQLFVRPDNDLSEGAVIAEIPFYGKVLLGGKNGDNYRLFIEKYGQQTSKHNTFNSVWNVKCICIDYGADPNASVPYYYSEELGGDVYNDRDLFEQLGNQLKAQGYTLIHQVFWYGLTDMAVYVYGKQIPLDVNATMEELSWQGTRYDTGLSLPVNTYSLITLKYDGTNETVSVNKDNSAALTRKNTKNYTIDSGNLNNLYPDYEVWNNSCLYHFEGGVKREEFNTYYDKTTNQYEWYPSNSTGFSTSVREVVTPFVIGGSVVEMSEEEAFLGNITEVRVWNHELNEKESTSYYDRILTGQEKGLSLYWPMDEGLNRYVFDASYANDLPNGRHATVGNNISVSTIIPVDNQLSRYAMTNENGEYIIRGIPFVGSGSTYTVLPTRGIHEFSPLSRNGFIGNGNLTLNSYDFTDVSSFPVRGKVNYLDTNIPSDSIQFKIDGSFVQTKDGMVMSDANGEYEISVPIGNHLIEAYKDGHRLTSFPLDGTTYEFKRAETVNFIDSTLVNVTGRINGGFSDIDAPLGFGQSVNRLGKATIKLSLGKESQCSFNYILNENGEGSFGTNNIPVASATEEIKSTAYRAGGEHDDTYFIYITTDGETGEFSAMLPPLKYKVESIRFTGGTDYDNEPVFAQNLPVIDATNTVESKMLTDSIEIDGVMETYLYTAKMLRQYRKQPSITVEQVGMKNGAFGDVKVPVFTLQNEIDTLQVVDFTGEGYSYKFGVPVFQQRNTYEFDINVAETYKNLDTKETFKEIPRDAVVSIINDASILTTVLGEKAILNGKEVEAGAEIATPNINVIPDSTGHVSYSFIGGWPNLATGYLRNMSIGVSVDGRTTMWQAPDSQTEALDLVLLGCLPTGSNFMSDGPDKIDYILRRPPGSTSVASLEKTTIDTYSTTDVSITDDTWGGGAYISPSPTWEILTSAGLGTGIISIMKNTKIQIVANETVTRVNGTRDDDYYTEKESYTFTEKVTTPNFMPISMKNGDYRPESGDTYIGHATNLTFSKARTVGIYQKSDGTYALAEKDGIAMSESFKTNFVYTQEYIEDYLIPNWKALIKDRLIHVEGNHWDPNNPDVKEVAGEVRYYTSYNEDDPEYGRANGDPAWGNLYLERGRWPSYRMVNGKDELVDDEVEHAINQIIAWEETMGENELDKLKAFDDNLLDDNHSISGGTTYSETSQTENATVIGSKHTTYHTINSETKFGLLFNNAGAYGIYTRSWHSGDESDIEHIQSKTTSVAWTLSDSDPRTALSVDVYKSPMQWGPIFRTRGGQTVNPYEGATYTQYCGRNEKLNEATMRVENPSLRVVGAAQQTNIPTGNDARFTLQLKNDTETGNVCTYVLQVMENSNPDGAILVIDGIPLSNGQSGRPIKMAAGEEVEKMLIVRQSDRSITKYEDIRIVLRSENDPTVISEPVILKVEFVPSSAHVDLAVDHTVLNKAYLDDYNGITATMSNLDRQDEGLQGIRLRYRRKGTDTWSLIKQWSMKEEDLTLGYEPMPEGSSFTEDVSFLDDGLYELQAQTFGKYGSEDVTYESNIIEITQDTHGPRILGMPSPEDGVLTYLNRNNMHLRFNEVLNGNAMSRSDNFKIEGGMNNVVYGGLYPDVAVQLNGERIETEATYLLSNSDYAFDLWFYRQGDGTIISMGTDNNLLSLATHDGGLLSARVGTDEDVYDAQVTLPDNQWIYMALNYKRKTESDPSNRLTMLYATANDKQPTYVGKDVPAKDLNGHGKLSIGGDGMVGMVSELSIWNSDKTASELFETRNELRAAYTPGLVGYWRMDEGHGTTLADRARSRHMQMPSESWYINNENRAAHIDKSHTLPIDISTFNPVKTDNYAIEMWFRGNEYDNASNSTLFSTLSGVRVGYDNRKLKLQVVDQEIDLESGAPVADIKEDIVLSENTYLDSNWHHFALNVRRGTSAIAYIDGEPIKVIPENVIPGIRGHYLYVGAWELLSSGEAGNAFTGDVDDIRIWSAALDGQLIKDRMYERMDSSYAGLVGYFPMENIHRNKQGTVTTDFSTANFGEVGSRLKIVGSLSQSTNAPALLPGSTKLRLDDSQFNFTVSDDEVYFTFYDSSLPLMDGNDFVVTVSDIKDEHGNNSEPASWMFRTDFACVGWGNDTSNDKYVVDVKKQWNEELTLNIPLKNKTSMPQNYEILGMPAWMTIDDPIGSVNEGVKYLEMTIAPTVPVGKYTQYLYVTDRLGIRRVMQLNLTVTGDEPSWSVNPALYESNMTLTGQVYVDGKICEYTDTKVAVFDSDGNCRGVASPYYVGTRDAYYIDMIVYGGSVTELTTSGRELTVKMYDASTGKIYPVVYLTLPQDDPESMRTTITYSPDANYGSYDDPVIFRSSNDIQQTMALNAGWSWVSIYVQPSSTDIVDVLPKGKTELLKYQNIKGQSSFATVKSDGSEIMGELQEIVPGNMYKVQLRSKAKLDVFGSIIDVTNTTQTIHPGYNWIGTLSSNVMSPADAFADLMPAYNDMVKNRTSVAYYRGNGVWEGTLKNIIPGEGYIYKSMAGEVKTFHYPMLSYSLSTSAGANSYSMYDDVANQYTPVDVHQYPDNMNYIAVVEKDGVRIENAEVGAFIDDICRGTVSCISGYYFLTAMGSAENDADKDVQLRIYIDGEEFIYENELPFVSDAVWGTLDEPYIIEINTTGIQTVNIDDIDDKDDTEWYTLQGLKVGRRPTQQGVYIHHGKKVTITRNTHAK